MCFANLGTLICQSCGRRVGEQPIDTSPCLVRCGKFVSRVTMQIVQGECGVCASKREERATMARRLNLVFGRY